MVDTKNYLPKELTLLETKNAEYDPLLEKIRVAKTKEEKLKLTEELVKKVRKDIESDLTGLIAGTVFTIIAEKFFAVGTVFLPSDNDKLNIETAEDFYKHFKDKLIDYVFSRASIEKFDNVILDKLNITLIKLANQDSIFRTDLIKKIDNLLKTKKGNIDGSVVSALLILPSIRAKELLPALVNLQNDKNISNNEKELYGAAIDKIRELLKKDEATKPKAKVK